MNVDQLTLFELGEFLQVVAMLRGERWLERLTERGWIYQPDGTVRRIINVCDTL